MRPHPFFDTLEFRVFDMPGTIEDTLALAALCQALVAKLDWLYAHNLQVPVFSRDYIEENKWRAMRYGLDAQVIDFAHQRSMSMRDAIHELLDFVEEVVDDLGSRREMNYLRALISDPVGTGADCQVAAYQKNNSLDDVTALLMERTMQGVELEAADLSEHFLQFKMYEPAASEQH